MSHLNDTGLTYFQHLIRAWKIAFVLIVHGLIPEIWKNKASSMLCSPTHTSTYKRLMDHYGIKSSE
jgi:hypothetical protein